MPTVRMVLSSIQRCSVQRRIAGPASSPTSSLIFFFAMRIRGQSPNCLVDHSEPPILALYRRCITCAFALVFKARGISVQPARIALLGGKLLHDAMIAYTPPSAAQSIPVVDFAPAFSPHVE